MICPSRTGGEQVLVSWGTEGDRREEVVYWPGYGIVASGQTTNGEIRKAVRWMLHRLTDMRDVDLVGVPSRLVEIAHDYCIKENEDAAVQEACEILWSMVANDEQVEGVT